MDLYVKKDLQSYLSYPCERNFLNQIKGCPQRGCFVLDEMRSHPFVLHQTQVGLSIHLFWGMSRDNGQ